MADRTLTAMYDSSSAAEAAREALVSAIPNAMVSVRGAGAGSEAGATSGGFWEDLKNLFLPDDDRAAYGEGLRRGGYLLTAQVPDGAEDQALDVLESTDPVDLDARSTEWRAEGWEGGTPATSGTAAASGLAVGSSGLVAPTGGAAYSAAEQAGLREDRSSSYAAAPRTETGRSEDERLQVIEEELRVGKREVGRGGVRVRSYVTERPVEEQVELRQEHVTIDRRPVDRELAPGEAAFQERTIEAVERGEEAVVSKTARVTEEVGLSKDVERETETVRDSVRKQDVEVEDERTAGFARTERERGTTELERDPKVNIG
jgi:uncharacterized protein (TIGR02271 family)